MDYPYRQWAKASKPASRGLADLWGITRKPEVVQGLYILLHKAVLFYYLLRSLHTWQERLW